MNKPIDLRPLIVIGIPAGDRVHTQFAQTLWGLGRGAKHHRQGIVIGQSSIVANGRNQCVQGMKQLNADYLMFIDSDMVAPWNTIDRLLSHDKDIVCGTYCRRGPPFDNLGHTLHETDQNAKGGLIEMTHVPTGMLLIRKNVIEALKEPWFRFGVDEETGTVRGEDFMFSEMARAAGFRLWCDVDLSKELGHMYQYELKVEDPATRGAVEVFKAAVNG